MKRKGKRDEKKKRKNYIIVHTESIKKKKKKVGEKMRGARESLGISLPQYP